MQVAGIESDALSKLANSPAKVAEQAYAGLLRGDLEVIDNTALKWGIKAFVPFIPTKFMLMASNRFISSP